MDRLIFMPYTASMKRRSIFGAVTGHLPPRALSHVEQWRHRHDAELMIAWEQAQAGAPPDKIEPLE
jgi:hypothetical protein